MMNKVFLFLSFVFSFEQSFSQGIMPSCEQVVLKYLDSVSVKKKYLLSSINRNFPESDLSECETMDDSLKVKLLQTFSDNGFIKCTLKLKASKPNRIKRHLNVNSRKAVYSLSDIYKSEEYIVFILNEHCMGLCGYKWIVTLQKSKIDNAYHELSRDLIGVR